jgi:hypothetical protein
VSAKKTAFCFCFSRFFWTRSCKGSLASPHGDYSKRLEKGCEKSKNGLDLLTAVALECPEKTDYSGFDASEDFQVFAVDLNADKQVQADKA